MSTIYAEFKNVEVEGSSADLREWFMEKLNEDDSPVTGGTFVLNLE